MADGDDDRAHVNATAAEVTNENTHQTEPIEAQDVIPDVPPVDISDDELAQCISVLQKFHSDDGVVHFQQPRFKQLRTAMLPLLTELRQKMFNGKSVSADARRQERKRKRKMERAREQALDQQYINNTKLRAERIARLKALTEENPLLAQVPDGVSGGDRHRLLAASASAEQDEKEQVEGDDNEVEAKDGASGVPAPALHRERVCYTCKIKFKELHHFYDRLCPACAALNYEKRMQTAKLDGRIAIVTGARVKIGYEIALKLLRSGAMVIATTRFPKDAALRYAKERDFDQWKDRLQVYGMDFRDLGVIDKFMDHIEKTFGFIDILINNATQTIRRPVHYYKHLLQTEVAPIPVEMDHISSILRGNTRLLTQASPSLGSENVTANSSVDEGTIVAARPVSTAISGSVTSAAAVPSSVMLSQIAVLPEDHESEDTSALFPQGQVDTNDQQVDLRSSNSWVMKIDEIETMELVEVFAINTMAPFILNRRAIPLLQKSTNKHKFIINVSAMEGKFYRVKSPNHPHTNMAKAAVNMMTRTCAQDLAKNDIFMNSVDTGWINDENPREVAVRIASMHNFQTPLDEIDAAARVLDPIFVLHQANNTNPPIYGQFLKDFKISEW